MIGSKSMVDQAWFIISYGILTSGLAPLMLSTYFFLICSKSRDHLWGLVIVLFAIVIHYIVTAFVAHNVTYIFAPMQIMELMLSVVVIVLWSKRNKNSTKLD